MRALKRGCIFTWQNTTPGVRGLAPGSDITLTLDILIDDAAWADADITALAVRAANALAAHMNLPEAEATLLATSDAHILQLNADFRAKPQATNVLSWPSAERDPVVALEPDAWGDLHLGDIALAYETIASEAQAQGKSLQAHTAHLIVHGLLHLLGYDHETEGEAARMERLEREILGNLGLPDPY